MAAGSLTIANMNTFKRPLSTDSVEKVGFGFHGRKVRV